MFSTLSSDGPEPVTEQQEDANRSLVINAVNRLFNDDLSVLDQYWSADYIQHNSQFANGVAVFKAFLEANPGLKVKIDYAVADGNYVLLFQQGIFPGQD